MNQDYLNELISKSLAIEVQDAKEAGKIGYMARALVQATMPHSKTQGNEFQRVNGAFTLTMLAPSNIGLPYGSIPRLLIAWISTEAVLTRERELFLGRSLSKFMEKIDLIPTGGRWGSITRLKDQAERLFSSSISCTYNDGEGWNIRNVHPVSRANLWWDPKSPNQQSLFESTLTLGEEFFKEIIASPIPIHMDVLKALKRSPMAIDIYCWLTYRMSYLRRKTPIPWPAIQVQFGSNYPQTEQGIRDFKKAFLRELKKVQIFYVNANVNEDSQNLILIPSKPHITKSKLSTKICG